MIKRLLLENWKVHAKSDFEFGRGTNVLVGAMGSGKTSLMDAICFALFADFPAANARRVNLEEVLTSKPNSAEFARVQLEFEQDGSEYVVERKIYRKGTNEGKLLENGKMIAGPKTNEVTKRLEQILEMNYELFSRAVYSEQNQIDYFLRLTPKQRREKFDELLDINRYEVARANAVALANRIKNLAKDKKEWLHRQRHLLDESEIEKVKIRRKEKTAEIEALRKTLLQLRPKIAEKKVEVEMLETQDRENRELRQSLERLVAKAEELKRNIERAKKEVGGKSTEAIKKEIAETEKKVAELQKEIQKTEKTVESQDKDLRQIEKELGVREQKIEEIEKEIERVKKLGAKCPTCKSELSGKRKGELVEESKLSVKKFVEETKKFEAEKASLEKEIEKLDTWQEKVGAEIDRSKEQVSELQRMLRDYLRIAEDEKLLQETERKALQTKEQIGKLAFDESKLKKVREEFYKVANEESSLAREIRAAEELLAEIEQNIKRFEQTKAQLEELAKEVEKSERVTEKLAIFTNALASTQAQLREAMINTINEAMADIWPRIYPYGDFLSAKVDITDGEYEIVVKDRLGKWQRVEGLLSGGERMAVAITMRISLSLVLAQKLSWLILDEPTHNLDVTAVGELAKMLKEHLPNLVEQIFVITHDRKLEHAASANLYILERDKSKDGATVAFVKEAVKAV